MKKLIEILNTNNTENVLNRLRLADVRTRDE
mgnify:CR=1 FL=1